MNDNDNDKDGNSYTNEDLPNTITAYDVVEETLVELLREKEKCSRTFEAVMRLSDNRFRNLFDSLRGTDWLDTLEYGKAIARYQSIRRAEEKKEGDE